MPRLDWTRILIVQLSILAAIVLMVLAWYALHAVLHTILLFVVAAILAFILAPLVTRGEARGLPRGVAVGLVYVNFAALLALAGALLTRPFLQQAAALVENMPGYVSRVQDHLAVLDRWLEGLGLGGALAAVQAEAARYLSTGGTLLLGDLIRILTQVAGSVVDTVLVLVISFYLLLDGPRLRVAALQLVPRQHRDKFLFVEESLARVVGGYLRGQLLMGVTLGIIVGVGLQLMGLQYAVVLGVLAGIFELVPMFGPILSALPALVVALFLPTPGFLWVLLFFIIVQQIENHILMPRISGHAVGLHPLGAIFALLAGFELGGPLGAIFAVPVAGFLWVVVTAVHRRVAGIEEPTPAPVWRFPGRRPEARPPEPRVEPPPASEARPR